MRLHQDKIYVACFTHREYESALLWKIYTKEEGVIIRFNNLHGNNVSLYCSGGHHLNKIERSVLSHKSYDKESDWGYLDFTIADIEYTNDFEEYVYIDKQLNEFYSDTIMLDGINRNFKFHLCQGLVKGIEWDDEEETRIRVGLRPIGLENVNSGSVIIQPKPSFDYIYLRLDDAILDCVSIILNPWATEEFKLKILKIVNDSGMKSCQITESSLSANIRLTD